MAGLWNFSGKDVCQKKKKKEQEGERPFNLTYCQCKAGKLLFETSSGVVLGIDC